MKLADFLHESRMTTTQLRRALGVSSRSTVTRYLHGERTPSLAMMMKIAKLTQGRVQPHDFATPGNPICATVITLPSGKKKLVFPWNTNAADLAAVEALERVRGANDNMSTPIATAIRELEHRVKRRGDQLWLDGRPSDARRVILAANDRRKRRGETPLAYPNTCGQ